MKETKKTKRVVLEAMKKWLMGEETDLTVEDGIAYCDNEIALLDRKAEKAKEAKEKKKAENDTLLNVVADALTDEFECIADITARVVEATGDEEISVHKVQYRLSALAKAEPAIAVKGEVTIKGDEETKSRTITAYKRA